MPTPTPSVVDRPAGPDHLAEHHANGHCLEQRTGYTCTLAADHTGQHEAATCVTRKGDLRVVAEWPNPQHLVDQVTRFADTYPWTGLVDAAMCTGFETLLDDLRAARSVPA